MGFLGVRLSVPAAAARWSGGDVVGRIEIDVEPLHPNGSALEPAAGCLRPLLALEMHGAASPDLRPISAGPPLPSTDLH